MSRVGCCAVLPLVSALTAAAAADGASSAVLIRSGDAARRLPGTPTATVEEECRRAAASHLGDDDGRAAVLLCGEANDDVVKALVVEDPRNARPAAARITEDETMVSALAPCPFSVGLFSSSRCLCVSLSLAPWPVSATVLCAVCAKRVSLSVGGRYSSGVHESGLPRAEIPIAQSSSANQLVLVGLQLCHEARIT